VAKFILRKSVRAHADKPILEEKGDLLGFDGVSWARIPIGETEGHVLQVSSASTYGVKWSSTTGQTGVPTTRSLVAGNGLTGGGDLSADRTFNVGAGSGIIVGADDVAIISAGVTPGTYQTADITVDYMGRVTSAATGAGGGGGTYAPSDSFLLMGG